MKLLPLLKSLLLLGLAADTGQSLRASEPPPAWGDQVWQLQLDPASGALVHLENRSDAQHMNWLREAGRWDGGRWLPDTFPTTGPGEVFVELRKDAQRTWLRANVVPPVEDLIAARVKFIVRWQQRDAPGDPLDGAYLSYDNETGQQVCDAGNGDHNAGRERLAMGVLGALYLPLCRDEAFPKGN